MVISWKQAQYLLLLNLQCFSQNTLLSLHGLNEWIGAAIIWNQGVQAEDPLAQADEGLMTGLQEQVLDTYHE